MKSKAKDYITITRPFNCFLAAVGCFLGYSLSIQGFSFPLELLWALLAVLFVCAGGQIINDFFDREIDKKIHPKKPLPSGRIHSKHAFMLAIALFILGIFFAFLINTAAFIIAAVFSLALFGYSSHFRKVKFLGNFVVAFGTGFTLIFGATISGNYLLPGILGAAAILVNLARELLKDLEQLPQEKGIKITLPQKISLEACLYLVFFYYLLAIILSYTPSVFSLLFTEWVGFRGLPYLAVISLANLIFVFSFKQSVDKKFKDAQKLSKASMALALLAFFLAIIFK